MFLRETENGMFSREKVKQVEIGKHWVQKGIAAFSWESHCLVMFNLPNTSIVGA